MLQGRRSNLLHGGDGRGGDSGDLPGLRSRGRHEAHNDGGDEGGFIDDSFPSRRGGEAGAVEGAGELRLSTCSTWVRECARERENAGNQKQAAPLATLTGIVGTRRRTWRTPASDSVSLGARKRGDEEGKEGGGRGLHIGSKKAGNNSLNRR